MITGICSSLYICEYKSFVIFFLSVWTSHDGIRRRIDLYRLALTSEALECDGWFAEYNVIVTFYIRELCILVRSQHWCCFSIQLSGGNPCEDLASGVWCARTLIVRHTHGQRPRTGPWPGHLSKRIGHQALGTTASGETIAVITDLEGQFTTSVSDTWNNFTTSFRYAPF